jgi:lysophospholipase L1-like esterase
MSERRRRPLWMKVVVPAAAFVAAMLVMAVVAGAADIYFQNHYRRSFGLNVWGYRGLVVGKKQPGEQRIAVLGGSTAYGYGVKVEESFPAILEEKLNARRRADGGGPVTVVNLAFNNEGAYSYKYTLRDYAYLDYDVVFLYAGYNDLGGPNTQVFRHQFPLFRLTGHVPILPLVIKERAMALRHGDIDAAYRGDKTTFTPNRTAAATAATLEAAANVTASLERQLARFADEYEFDTSADALCPGDWDFFCRQMHDAIALALSMGKRVIVVTDPYMTSPTAHEKQPAQRRALESMLAARFAGRGVAYRSMGDAIDMADSSLQFDGMHLTPLGNERLAGMLVDPVLDILRISE